eukprot:c26241_g1_i1 orf=581-1753(+)
MAYYGTQKHETIVKPALLNGVVSYIDSDKPRDSAKKIVDLRSDTVTKPTPEMRAAMANAEVDDDVLGEDPTAAHLQKHMAQILGKEAGLFVPSGTMGNLISVLAHCESRGSEVILGSECHIYLYEQGGISTLGHVHPRIVTNCSDGTMDLREVAAAIRPSNDDLLAATRLICIENTHGSFAGRCISVEYTDKIGELAKKYGLKLHIDGARIFNAAIALKVPAERLVQSADSVSVCLSKGLGAPAGTIIVGSSDFIRKAKRLRKALGGGMRQVGVLAAPGLVALNDMVGRLTKDHQNARLLADGLNSINGLQVDSAAVETNMVVVEVAADSTLGAEELCDALKESGILSLVIAPNILRLVTHHQVSKEDILYAIECFKDALQNSSVENGSV